MARWQSPLYFGAVAALWLGVAVRSLVLARASRGWPTTEGRLLDAELGAGTLVRGRVTPFHALLVRYEYRVAGTNYRGERLAFGWRPLLAQRARMRQLRAGRSVTVAYDPARPQRAVLDPGVSGWTLLSAAGATCALGLVCWWALTLR